MLYFFLETHLLLAWSKIRRLHVDSIKYALSAVSSIDSE